jgi:hypothetical protein
MHTRLTWQRRTRIGMLRCSARSRLLVGSGIGCAYTVGFGCAGSRGDGRVCSVWIYVLGLGVRGWQDRTVRALGGGQDGGGL